MAAPRETDDNPPGEICCACGAICEPEMGTPEGWRLHFCKACRKAIGPGKVVELQLLAKVGEDWRRFVARFAEALDDDQTRGAGGAMGFSPGRN